VTRRGAGLRQLERIPHWPVVTATDGTGIDPGSSSPRPPGVTPVRPLSYVERPVQGSSKLASTCPITSARISRPLAALGSLVSWRGEGRPQGFSVRPFPTLCGGKHGFLLRSPECIQTRDMRASVQNRTPGEKILYVAYITAALTGRSTLCFTTRLVLAPPMLISVDKSGNPLQVRNRYSHNRQVARTGAS
jgi:hypothetical protein